jgi:hypothetical protein
VRRGGALALAAAAAAALLAAAVTPPPPARAAGECNGLPRCISVPGPWVAVPASGEVDYLLECPGAKGVVGGTDALVSSQAVHVSFDGIPGSPVAYGRTTSFQVLFRAVSGDHRAAVFQPYIGCIPVQGSGRITTGVAAVLPLGPPLDLKAEDVPLGPGVERSVSVACGIGEHLVDSWTATAFATAAPPRPELAATVSVHGGVNGGVASAALEGSEALPASAHALVQLGVRCTPA